MAFIREYAAESGDPFRLRIPKRWRRAPVGHWLGQTAKRAAMAGISAVPGVGPVLGFARDYGMDLGDPAPKPAARRKGAAAGPAAKAQKKATGRKVKAAKAAAKMSGKKRGKKGGGIDLHEVARQAAGYIPVGGELATRALDWAHARDQAAAAGGGGAFDFPGTFGGKARGFGGHRRRTNPANVHALRRALRRVEGFEKLAKKIMGHGILKRRNAPTHAAGARTRGHKSGCRCAVCAR